MPTDPSSILKKRQRDPWRLVYRFSADQVFKMVEHGILPPGDHVELWDGVLYRLGRSDLHNFIISKIADVLRQVTPGDSHVREEKSCSYADHSLPEPDVGICRGGVADSLPNPPSLAKLSLVVEVDPSTKAADQDERHWRYAEVRIPVYWQVGAEDRLISVYRRPEGHGESARYQFRETYGMSREIPIVIDDEEVGRIAVANVFPRPTEAKP